MRAYTLHVTFVANDDDQALAIGEQLVQSLVAENSTVGTADWDVSDTVDWAEIIPRTGGS